MRIPFNDLSRRYAAHKEEIDATVERVLKSGRYIRGPHVEIFEKSFGAFLNAPQAVGVNSGTDALVLALRALDIGVGDEVITVANTCTPTIAAIRLAGAVPIFVDIEEGTRVMDPVAIEVRITTRTKAILPVHLYGFPVDMPAIMKVARAHNLLVIEDCAQSIGATIDGHHTGTFGDAGCFSFYPTKNLGAFGDGGAIIFRDGNVAQRARRIAMYGEERRYVSVEEGLNSRLDELQAALLEWGLRWLPKWQARRETITERYLSEITNPYVALFSQQKAKRKGVWHLFVIEVNSRAEFIEHMSAQGIECAIHYPTPVYAQPAYAFLNENGAHLPSSIKSVSRVVSLPLFPELTDEEVVAVIAAANSYTPISLR